MLTAIKKGFQKRALESLRTKVNLTRERYFTPLDKVKNVLILYKVGSEDAFSELDEFISKLGKRGIAVETIIVGKQKNLTGALPSKPNFYPIGYQDVRWDGVPKNETVIKLLQNSHDYFIDLTRLESGLCTYLTTSSLAKFKIGCVNEPNSPYDFTVEVGSDASLIFFEEQMFTYLQKIG
jgi:hypothetical protein